MIKTLCMAKVLLLGADGMLGSAVYGVLREKHQLILTVRKREEIEALNRAYGGVGEHQIEEFECAFVYQNYFDKKGGPGEYLSAFLEKIGEVDWVINVIGITIPFSLDNPLMTLFINGGFPHILAGIFGTKLIHITTDCVYNGKEGFPYDENSPKTPVDIYGLSKALGEPKNCLTLRSSLIGRELKGFTGLLDWFLQQEGKEIPGFTNHFWNGITTKQFGKICNQIMQNPTVFPQKGIYHIFSQTISKYDMLLKFQKKYNLKCEIIPDGGSKLNRTLSTIYPFCSQLQIPSFDEMLEEL